MAINGAAGDGYRRTLLRFYEEEVMGAGYFEALARRFSGSDYADKLGLLAEVERHAARAVRPLLARHGLVPRDHGVLLALGEADAQAHLDWSWGALLAHIAGTYGAYVRDFEALERRAPAADRAALARLTAHEIAAIAFAERELAGAPDSLAPLHAYLAQHLPMGAGDGPHPGS